MPKTFKSSSTADAGLRAGESNIRMQGNDKNWVSCDERGTTVSGPVSFATMPNQIRFGGLWVMSPAMQLSIPSTLATPGPVLRIDPPVKDYANLMKQTVVMMGLCGMLSSI